MNCADCENSSGDNPLISFLSFPKETPRCKEWAELCNVTNLHEEHSSLQFYKSSNVCSDHFDSKDIVYDGKQNATSVYFPPPESPEEPKLNYREFMRRKAFKLRLVKSFCRLCAKRYRNLTNIFSFKGKTLKLEKKLDFLPIIINKFDVLPLRICQSCISKLSQFYDFIKSCVRAEKKLKIMMDMINSEIRNKPDHSKKPFQENLKQIPLDTIEDDSSSIESDEDEFAMCTCNENVNQTTFEFNDYSKVESTQKVIRLKQCFKVKNSASEVDFSQSNNLKHDYTNIFKNVQQLNQQLQTQNQDQTLTSTEPEFQCNVCSETFQTADILNSHLLSHCPEEKLPDELICKTCNEKFDSEFLLNEHVLAHTLKNCYKCQICDIYFPSFAYFEKHNKKLHRVLMRLRSIQPSLDLESLDYNLMSANYKTHEPHKSIRIWKPRKNVKCLKVIYKPKPERKCICYYCGKIFVSRRALRIHEKCHKGKSPYQCRYCNKKFRSRRSLRQHRSAHSDKWRYLCQNCGITFRRKKNLQNHMKTHMGERPFFCKVCGFAFRHQDKSFPSSILQFKKLAQSQQSIKERISNQSKKESLPSRAWKKFSLSN